MPHRRIYAFDSIEQDFYDALDRLKAGLPQNPKHKGWLKSRGAVPINISTVAREAGRSRTLIAAQETRYQKVRNAILVEAESTKLIPGNRNDVIVDLRAQVAELRLELRSAREHSAYNLKRRIDAETRTEVINGRYERLSSTVKKHDTRRSVTHLFPEDEK